MCGLPARQGEGALLSQCPDARWAPALLTGSVGPLQDVPSLERPPDRPLLSPGVLATACYHPARGCGHWAWAWTGSPRLASREWGLFVTPWWPE